MLLSLHTDYVKHSLLPVYGGEVKARFNDSNGSHVFKFLFMEYKASIYHKVIQMCQPPPFEKTKKHCSMRTRTYLKFRRSINGKPKSGLNIFQKVNGVYIRFFNN